MRKRRWFLPETPDLVGQLRAQTTITLEGLDGFVAWAEGEPGAAESLPEIEHRGDAAKRELLEQLRKAFVTPLEPEDVYTISRGLDWILDYARDLVRESDAMKWRPNKRLAEMARLLREAVGQLDDALGQLGSNGDAATAAADRAIKTERRMEVAYYQGMAESLEVDSRQERISNRELYRRCARIGDEVIDVAERIVYSVVKGS
jgi:uncharacterized protein